MPRSLTSLCASVCSLILIACSSGNVDTAEPSEESDIPVEVETSTEDSSVRESESAENDGGDIDPSTKSDDGLANASETIEINRAYNINTLIESLPIVDSQTFSECFIDTLATETGLGDFSIATKIDFAIKNGVSRTNIAPEEFLAFEAALTTCNGFLSQDDVQLVTEMLIVESTEQPTAC
ncbi:MAG: hypothetical protein ACPG7Y_08270, partial [Acidimicrobiales bacterium]